MINPFFPEQREKALNGLDINKIDVPLHKLIDGFSKLPYCFTMQCCYGHFVHEFQKDEQNIEPLTSSQNILEIEYRIAYIGFCIQNSDIGNKLYLDLRALESIDPNYIQFGCAEWFWKKQVNSYVLQVEPDRYKTKDTAIIDFQEALHMEKTRNEFFDQLQKLIIARESEIQA
jgi:hypothetical protein